MLLQIPKVLTSEEVAECRRLLLAADWSDGRATAGHLSVGVKNNRQVRYDHATARGLGSMILARLERHPLFVSAALPSKVVPPLFNRYEGGEAYGPHVDGSVRPVEGTQHRVRTDLSATVFLSDPEAYEGGELVIADAYGPRTVKLPAGDMILYPGASIHEIQPVTKGLRLAAFFWVQSMVREDADRALLFQLDTTIQTLPRGTAQERAAVVELTNVYHNLIRRWADI